MKQTEKSASSRRVSVVGTIEICANDPSLERADEAVRLKFEEALLGSKFKLPIS
jgi:hypothetical protein